MNTTPEQPGDNRAKRGWAGAETRAKVKLYLQPDRVELISHSDALNNSAINYAKLMVGKRHFPDGATAHATQIAT